MLLDPSLPVSRYPGHSFECTCGRMHGTRLRELIVKPGALSEVPSLLGRLGFSRPLLVCDANTYAAAGERLCALLREAGAAYDLHRYPDGELIADEAALGALLMALTPENDSLLAVGSGTVNDLCKFVGYSTGRPYAVVGTAPSMDGFTSGVCALIRGNMKVTLNATMPLALVGDTDVLCRAPMDMIRAGVGDILGKYTCLLDWKLSRIINGEYYCPAIAEMMARAVDEVAKNAEGVGRREPEAVAAVMNALALSGIAMSYSVTSRPASGCEHHVSHFLEMRFMSDGRPPVLHGRKVGAATVMAADCYHRLAEKTPDFDAALASVPPFDPEAWAGEIRRHYGRGADGVIELERRVKKNDPDRVKARVLAIRDNWDEIRSAVRALPSAREIEAMLRACGAPASPAEIGVEAPLLREGIRWCKEVRDRYTLWQMLYDLGLLDKTADWAAPRYGA